MKIPNWVQDIEWLHFVCTTPLFEKYMLPNILKNELECKALINDKICPYFKRIKKCNDFDHVKLGTIVLYLLMDVDIYCTSSGREKITEARNKLKEAADTADKLATILREIKGYEDTDVFLYPASLEDLLEMQDYVVLDLTKGGKDTLETETLLKNMAANLRETIVGTPTLEWIDDHKTNTDKTNVVTRSLQRHIDPPSSVISAFIFLCFGSLVEESAIQKFNSPSRKKHYKSDIHYIKFNP